MLIPRSTIRNQRTNRDPVTAERRGLTLFEIIIVLVLLVLVASLAIPTFQRSFKSQRLKRAADIVRAEWNRAKIHAIREGEEFAFFYQPETGQYWLAPFSSVYADQGPPETRAEAQSNYDYGNGLLPKGIFFYQGETLDDARMESTASTAGVTNLDNLVLFYPDGTSQDAEIVLRNEDDFYIRVTVRALTGVSSVGEVTSDLSEEASQ